MSTNYLVNVPKLKGRENYDDWCFAAENVLVLEGMADSIKQPLPSTATQAQIADDLKAKAKLILTIDASLYVHIKQATSTYSLWKILKNMFDDSGYARKISLLRNLISIRLENCESMTSYVSQIIETAQKLNGTGFEINDQWIGSLMLAGLPEKFSPMIMAIEHSGINISADAIKTKLLDMSAEFEVKSEGAFAAKKFHRRYVGSTAKPHVQHYGKTGTNGTSFDRVQNMASKNKIIRCYKCNQIGHFKNQCQVAEKLKTNAFSAVFLTKKFSQLDWHLDSGASTHIVSNVDLLSNVSNRLKIKEIIVANQTVVPVSCSGDLQITTCVGNNEFTIDVNDVLCVPNLTTNLLSVSRIIASGNRVMFNKHGCLIYNSQNDCIGEAILENGVYRLIVREMQQPLVATVKTSSNTWHRRLGHINTSDLNKLEKRSKWDKKAKKMYLVGYSESVKGYRLYYPESRDVIVARDVIIMEKTDDSLSTSIMIEESRQPDQSTEEVPGNDSEEENQHDETYVPDNSGSDYEDTLEKLSLSPEAENIIAKGSDMNLPGKRVRRKPNFYQSANMCVEMSDEQISLSDAMSGSEKHQWQSAMQQELKSFQDNDSWELVDRPSEGTIVKNKWVFKKKYNTQGEVRYRARLVAKGFTQEKGIDFNETFSPVLRYSTFRLLLALSVQLNLKMNHLDVPTAFLNGFLHETIYMEIPEYSNIVNCNRKVLKLKKAIYGLKQSARAWYSRVEDCLLKLEFKRSNYEPCLFMKNENNVMIYIALFVDDFFVFYNCQNTYLELINELVAKFSIKDLGEIKQCLGMCINVHKDCITVDQEHFIESILKKFNMTDCSYSNTPMEINLKLEKDVKSKVVQKFPYQQLIGSLMYLSVLTRPDISYSVSFLSQYNNCFNETHWRHLKRLLKYLKKTKRYALIYRKTGCNLYGFVDADWASCTLDRRSYTGFCFIMAGSVISYEAKKQKTVALSSTEAEYMALSESCKEGIYLKNILRELINLDETVPMCLYSDNQSSIKLATNPLFSNKRTKHIDARHHFVRECISQNKVVIKYLSTSEMPADIFTKSLSANKHYKFLNMIGMSEIEK